MFEDQLEDLKSENNIDFYEMMAGLNSNSISILTVKVCLINYPFLSQPYLVILY